MQYICIYDGTRHARILGWSLSLNETGSDYYIAARGIRNTAEYLSSLEVLPNNVKFPCFLPSPLPPFDKERPLSYDEATGKYAQISTGAFRASYSACYTNETSRIVRDGISDNVVFSPPLINDPAEG